MSSKWNELIHIIRNRMSDFSTFLHMKHFLYVIVQRISFLPAYFPTFNTNYWVPIMCLHCDKCWLWWEKQRKFLPSWSLQLYGGNRYYQLMILTIVLLERWVSKRKGIYFKEGKEPENLIKNGWRVGSPLDLRAKR